MKYLIYKNKEKVEIIDEDRTHFLIRFNSGSKICISKDRYADNEIYEGELK